MSRYHPTRTNDPRDREPQIIEGVTVSRASWTDQVYLNLSDDVQIAVSEADAIALGVTVPSRVVQLPALLTEEQLQVLASPAVKTNDLDLDNELQRAARAALESIEKDREAAADFQKGITEVEVTSDSTA